jgi:hypothetical protein
VTTVCPLLYLIPDRLPGSQKRKTRTDSRKRLRVDDSDEEIEMLSPVGIASNSLKDKTPVPSSSQPGEELDNKSVCPRYCCSLGLTLLLTLRRISSKDAYMLVYTRTPLPDPGHSSGSVSASNSLTVSVPFPPQHTSKAVHAINSTHEEACKTYAEKYYLTISFYVCLA